MKTIETIILSLLLLVGGLFCFSECKSSKADDDMLPPSSENRSEDIPDEHPRLYLRAKDISAINEKIKQPSVSEAWEKINEFSTRDIIITGKHDEGIEETILANALIYVLKDDHVAGQKAIDNLLEYLSPLEYPANFSRKKETTIGMGAMVYDWCYDLLSESQKHTLIKVFIEMAKDLEVGYPPIHKSAVTSHGGEYMLQRDLLGASIAIYDEYPEMYDLVSKRFFDEFVPARKFIYQAKTYHQGTHYALLRFQCDLYPTWIFSRMGRGNIYSENQGDVPYTWIYARRPDGQLLYEGDVGKSSQVRGYYWDRPEMNLLAGSFYKDPYILEQFFKEADLIDFPFQTILFYDPDVLAKPHSELPLTLFLPKPKGSMYVRTGWDEGLNSDAVVAEMKIKEYHFNNHDHLDAGTFQIYYKGQLASVSGIYAGKNGHYGSEHDINYNKRTISHNAILVYNPDEQLTISRGPIVNDGGQRWPNNGSEPATIDEVLDNMKVAELLAHDYGPDSFTPDYSYIKGDITEAYSNKVQKHERSMIFLNLKNESHPAAMVVFDKVTASSPDFKKYWLLHCIEEPDIESTTADIRRTTFGYNGRMVNETLLPEKENLEIKKLGGPGKDHYVFGVNYDEEPKRENSWDESHGCWRIELSPKEASATDYFLNIMQIMDNEGGPKPLAVTKITGTGLTGLKISDRVVVFRQKTQTGNKYELNVPGNEPLLKYTLADFEEGGWMVEQDGQLLKKVMVDKDSGILYFEGNSGNFAITKE